MKKLVSILFVLVFLFLPILSILTLVNVSANNTIATASIPLDWEGEYDGQHNSIVVRRNINIYIDKIDTSGNIHGQAVISPSDKAASSYGVNGSYYFKGTYRADDSTISLQGYEWIDYPIGYDTANFSFVYLTGKIDLSSGTITGTSDNGMWKMTSINYDKYNKESGFTLGVDNNSFAHSNNEIYANSGFKGITTYPISAELYNDMITNWGLSSEEKKEIKTRMSKPWEGSCYGISSTIGLLYNGIISLEDLSNSKPTSYFDLSAPYVNSQLLDSINGYQIIQYLSSLQYRYVNTIAYNNKSFIGMIKMLTTTGDDSLSVCLREIVNTIEDNKVYMLCYTTFKSGHAVLVVGSRFDKATNEYVLKIYDPNSVVEYSEKYKKENKGVQDFPIGEFREMRIKSDFSGFEYNGVNESNFVSLYFVDWAKYDEKTQETQNIQLDDTVDLTVSIRDFYVVRNDKGQYISFDGNNFSGDLPIHNIYPICYGDDSLITFEVAYSDQFTVTCLSEEVNIDIFSNDRYLSLNGSNVSELTFNLNSNANEAIVINGDNYSYKAFIGTNQQLDNGEYGLVSVEETTEGYTVISENNNLVTVKNETAAEQTIMTSYIETNSYSIIEKDVQEMSLSADNIKQTKIKNDRSYETKRNNAGIPQEDLIIIFITFLLAATLVIAVEVTKKRR